MLFFNKKRISDDRIRYMHSVAELMYKHYNMFDCNVLSQNQVYLLGLNCDIGYINGEKDHEFTGSTIFSNVDALPMIVKCIRYHESTPDDFMNECGCLPKDIPGELVLLWWASLMVEFEGKRAGEVIGLNEKLKSIERRS